MGELKLMELMQENKLFTHLYRVSLQFSVHLGDFIFLWKEKALKTV